MQNECAVRKFLVGRFVKAALSGPRDEAFQMKLIINCIGTVLAEVNLRPDLGQAVVVGSPALSARPMASRERGSVVEEEQLRITARRHERRPTSAAKPQTTGNPSPCSVKPANRSTVVVKTPAVAVDEPSLSGGDQISQRRDTVLKWHTSRLAGADNPPPPANPRTRTKAWSRNVSIFCVSRPGSTSRIRGPLT
jgi:hypothetical protein